MIVFFLIIALIIAGIIIYRLNDENLDNKLIIGNNIWKEENKILKDLIKNWELEKHKSINIGDKKNEEYFKDEIKRANETILKNLNAIRNNEEYLKAKGRI